ncbi:MAG: LysM peptidoglycan-binding domain-containing protein [Chloroflexi bacterium]|nr:LysM peptidoglycan-binding domain-containing protein [Chloroflexota bacterium]
MRQIIMAAVLVAVFLRAGAARADGGTHTVQAGETLFRIALNHGVSVDALRSANGIVGNIIYTGQVLVIPGAATNTTPESQPAAASSSGVHVVQRGENLFRIGLKYGVSVSAIQTANGLAGNTIYVGQRLTIPGAGAPTTPTTDAATTPAPTDTSAVAAPAAPSGGGKRFLVDLSDQMLYAYEGDTLVRSTLISSGRWPYLTVTGTYYIYLRYTSQRMRGPGYDLPGVPYVMYFYQGYALHGTYWHNNFGTPMSHGCVNMPTAEAEWAFNWASSGTPVTVQQ